MDTDLKAYADVFFAKLGLLLWLWVNRRRMDIKLLTAVFLCPNTFTNSSPSSPYAANPRTVSVFYFTDILLPVELDGSVPKPQANAENLLQNTGAFIRALHAI